MAFEVSLPAWSRGTLVAALPLLLLTSLVGCGVKAPSSWVSGQVLLDGQPIAQGNLRMDPVGASASPGGVSKIVDGHYAIPREKGMLSGKYRVMATATRFTGRKVKVREPQPGQPSEQDEIVQYLPERYGEASQIVVELSPGENVKDFDWKSE